MKGTVHCFQRFSACWTVDLNMKTQTEKEENQGLELDFFQFSNAWSVLIN